MFIETERTPNPATLKFLPDQAVTDGGSLNVTTPEDAQGTPLAEALFALGDVTGAFFGPDFIAVTKAEGGADWVELKPAILAAIMQHLREGPVATQAAGVAADADDPADADIIAQIRDLLETRVRPAVARDGGDIVYKSFQNGIVYLHMQGACSGCPSSTMTLKNGIETLLKHYVPEVTEVRAVA
ncbi:MAG: NifU family protein [Sphingomonadales bacterium]|nr:MAG: NifU family protein [Sphingomonadales bacterium]